MPTLIIHFEIQFLESHADYVCKCLLPNILLLLFPLYPLSPESAGHFGILRRTILSSVNGQYYLQVVPSPYTFEPYILTSADLSYANQYSPYAVGEGPVCQSYGYFW